VNSWEVIIVGAGPAGLATALQLERYGIKPLVIERNKIGGLLHNANLVENYPGFPGGITGPQLIDRFKSQIEDYEVNFLKAQLNFLDIKDSRFEFRVNGKTLFSNIAVIASGTKPRIFDFHVPGEISNLVSYEIYPLLGEEGKQIAIVGAGDAAFDYALNLSKQNNVIILNRSRNISCLPLLLNRSKSNPRIQYLEDTMITEVSLHSDGKISLHCNTPQGFHQVSADFLVGAIGREPNLDFLSSQFSEKAIQLENSGKLYFVGDVINGFYRQTGIAVGNGISAAMKIYNHLKENL
jgi:thioredoxin reductase